VGPGTCNINQNFAATALDSCAGQLTATCTPGSFQTDHTGSTQVTCSATDASGNTGSCSFLYSVTDNTAPVLSVPSSQTVAATSVNGATVSYTVTATDDCALQSLVCTSGGQTVANSGSSVFPIGSTTITCTATDKSGNSATSSFTITVTNNPPTITCPASAAAECTGDGQAAVSFTVTASDAQDGALTPSCSARSGSIFPVGTTTVSCSVTDLEGASASCSFPVTVSDTQKPVIDCPTAADFSSVECQYGGHASLSIEPTAYDVCDCEDQLAVTCTPDSLSGFSFPLGATSVSCSAHDSHGNNAVPCAFTVTVVDTKPPILSKTSGSITICADDQLHTVDANACGIRAFDSCSASVVTPTLSCVQSDESIALNTDVVASLPGATSVQLKASTSSGNGRVYLLSFKATDSAGNSAKATCQVNVVALPAAGATAVKDALSFAIPSGCLA